MQEVYGFNPAEIYRPIPFGVAQVVVKVVVNSLRVMGVGLQKAGDLIVASPPRCHRSPATARRRAPLQGLRAPRAGQPP